MLHAFPRALVIAGLCLSAPAGFPAQEPDAAAGAWQQKVDAAVLAAAESGETEFLVFLKEQADLSHARGLATKEDKGQFVFAQLRGTAARTQSPLLARLAQGGVEHRSFWVANMVWVKAGLDVVEDMARRPDVDHVFSNPWVRFQGPVHEEPAGLVPEAIEWGVLKINAPQVWDAGFTGQNVVIGGQDTGYDWDHPALKDKYRGWNGAIANHNYNWHDAIHVGGSNCGADSPEPCDDNNHGTHTMGTMVGDDGGANQVGVAPGARWIGCRNMNEGVGTPATYSECFQWFIAPTDLSGQNPDPTRAPHVINNSWGCPPSEGCSALTLQTVVENTRAAGILVVVSAGNGGGSCSTVDDPPAIYDASFSVGATDSSDNIAGFSSRGPVTIDGSGRLKPDVSAPGVGVRSSIPGGGYSNMQGTSMAGPHVAGQAALLMSAHPSLRGQVDQLESILARTAVPRTTSQECGGVPGTADPNNTFGYGRVDALAAVTAANVAVSLTAAPNPAYAGQSFTYTALVSNAGPGVANRVRLTDTLPPGVTFNLATPSQGTCAHSAGTVTCMMGTLAVGASATVAIRVTPAAVATITNYAQAVAGQLDLFPSNNSTQLTINVVACPPAAPAVTAPLATPAGTTGLQASVPAAAGHTFTWTLTGGTITAGQGTRQITFTAGSAGTTMKLSVVDRVGTCSSAAGTRNVQVHFLDVPPSHPFHAFVNTLARNEVTSGCTAGNYCPADAVTRAQMAVFLLRSKDGGTYAPPACATPSFDDVPCTLQFAAWIYELAARGITGGCSSTPPLYCPGDTVTRRQMAKFLLLAKESSTYVPPPAEGVFDDVPVGAQFADFIEELARRGITGGCQATPPLYCPDLGVTRGQMAAFLVRTFALQ